ncbi:MAG: hypothetical protein F2923_06640 [Actinobacteria bacterium]|uniref:Unannotated protein n=1 Tax=freshwater metagenome TaxID=449393 RepID=A0A6J7SJS5_9ZZZZ|nr:hypothetical protein [Actinomycetota bacterium]MTB28303.1 hypothetical protein [Actinomycetota bacterium]
MKEVFTAQALRDGKWWVVSIEGTGKTQGKTLREAKEMAVDMISLFHELDATDFEVELIPVLPIKLDKEVKAARAAIVDLELRQIRVAKKSRKAAQDLVQAAGLTGKDAAEVLGISAQRVSQLLRADG